MTEKIKNCGNCLFCDELSWGFLQCKISGEYVGSEQFCNEWEDKYIIIDAVLFERHERNRND